MKTGWHLSASICLLLAVACGDDADRASGTTAEPSAEAAPSGERAEVTAVRARVTAAQAEIVRIDAERTRAREQPAPTDGERAARLREGIERDDAAALAALALEEAEMDFYGLVCPDVRDEVATYRETVARERTARRAWLAARLASVAADVAETDLLMDDDATDDAVEQASALAAEATAHRDELEEPVTEAADARADLRGQAREACAERIEGLAD